MGKFFANVRGEFRTPVIDSLVISWGRGGVSGQTTMRERARLDSAKEATWAA